MYTQTVARTVCFHRVPWYARKACVSARHAREACTCRRNSKKAVFMPTRVTFVDRLGAAEVSEDTQTQTHNTYTHQADLGLNSPTIYS